MGYAIEKRENTNAHKHKKNWGSKRETVNRLRSLNKSGRIALLCLLLLVALGLLIFTAIQTVQQIRSFQQHSREVKAGDVHTVRPWMTVHAVSHIYHVPENYLYNELKIQHPSLMSHATLDTIAKTRHKSVNNVIQDVQRAILTYRKAHPSTAIVPPLTLAFHKEFLSLLHRRRREA
jgi:nitrogen fixation/metabolism regulation signal transduction histidine kinase